jgi:integration host factor subunit alpha
MPLKSLPKPPTALDKAGLTPRCRLDRAASGQYPHHRRHRQADAGPDGPRGRHRAGPRQHLGRLDPAGAVGRQGPRADQAGDLVVTEAIGGGLAWGASSCAGSGFNPRSKWLILTRKSIRRMVAHANGPWGDEMSEKTLTRMDLSEAVFREVGLSRNESASIWSKACCSTCPTRWWPGETVKISSFGTFSRPRQDRPRRPQPQDRRRGSDPRPRRVLTFRPRI